MSRIGLPCSGFLLSPLLASMTAPWSRDDDVGCSSIFDMLVLVFFEGDKVVLDVIPVCCHSTQDAQQIVPIRPVSTSSIPTHTFIPTFIVRCKDSPASRLMVMTLWMRPPPLKTNAHHYSLHYHKIWVYTRLLLLKPLKLMV